MAKNLTDMSCALIKRLPFNSSGKEVSRQNGLVAPDIAGMVRCGGGNFPDISVLLH